MQPQQHMAPMVTQPQLQQQQQQNNQSGTSKYALKAIFGLSIVHLILGFIVIIFGVVTIALKCHLYQSGAPLWCGVLFIVTGIIGVLTRRKTSTGYLITFLVLSVVSAVFAGIVLLTIESIALSGEDWYNYDYGYDCYDYRTHSYNQACERRIQHRKAIDGVLLFLSIVVAVMTILSSSFSCAALCCKRSRTPGIMYYVSSQPGGIPMQVPAGGVQQGQVVLMPYGPQVVGTGGQQMQPVAYYPNTQPMYGNQQMMMVPPQQQQQQQQQLQQQQQQPHMYQSMVPQPQPQLQPATQPQPQPPTQPTGGQVASGVSPPTYSSIALKGESSPPPATAPQQHIKAPLLTDS